MEYKTVLCKCGHYHEIIAGDLIQLEFKLIKYTKGNCPSCKKNESIKLHLKSIKK